MSELNLVTKEEYLALHSMLIARFGGADGMGDEKAFETSLDRPLQHLTYGDPPPNLFEIAAIYCSGIVKRHPFLDGNKRSGFVTAVLFLESNGYQFEATEEVAALQILALADCRLDDEALAQWLKANCTLK